MSTIVLTTMPASESSGMVFYVPFASSLELQQAQSIEQAIIIGRAMIARAKTKGQGATLVAHVYGRKPNSWNTRKHELALNTFQ